MTSEEIIRLARSVGIHRFKVKYLARFVNVVAAAERERLKWDGLHSCHPECDRPACVHTRKAVDAEREACAKVCEAGTGEPIQMKTLEILRQERERIAAAIRARGQQ